MMKNKPNFPDTTEERFETLMKCVEFHSPALAQDLRQVIDVMVDEATIVGKEIQRMLDSDTRDYR